MLAAVLILAAVPVSCSIGTALYSQAVEQMKAHNAVETAVAATLSAEPVDTVTSSRAHDSEAAIDHDWRAPVGWTYQGKMGSATVTVPSTAQRGGQVQVWLGPDGRPSSGPVPTSVAAFHGIGSAVTLLIVVISAVACAAWGPGRLLDRQRSARWEAEWRLVDRNGTITP